MSWEKFDINIMQGGSVVESLHAAVADAIKDIRDMNKPSTKVRRVSLILDFLPDEDRLNIAAKGTIKKDFPTENPNIDIIQIQPETKEGFINSSEQLPLGYDPVTGEVPMIKRGG